MYKIYIPIEERIKKKAKIINFYNSCTTPDLRHYAGNTRKQHMREVNFFPEGDHTAARNRQFCIIIMTNMKHKQQIRGTTSESQYKHV